MRYVAAILGVAVVAIIGCAETNQSPPAAAERNVPPAKKALPPVSQEILTRVDADFVRIPAGSLPSRWEKHVKQPPIPVGSFWMARHEVTQRDWVDVMGENPSEGAGDPMLPVTNLSWRDAHRFIDRLNQAKGAPIFRLPTAQEWELGCRGGACAGGS